LESAEFLAIYRGCTAFRIAFWVCFGAPNRISGSAGSDFFEPLEKQVLTLFFDPAFAFAGKGKCLNTDSHDFTTSKK
jgi:hypothetical protein